VFVVEAVFFGDAVAALFCGDELLEVFVVMVEYRESVDDDPKRFVVNRLDVLRVEIGFSPNNSFA